MTSSPIGPAFAASTPRFVDSAHAWWHHRGQRRWVPGVMLMVWVVAVVPTHADPPGDAAMHPMLRPLRDELLQTWPGNRTIRLVFHGHSVPAGYFDTPTIRRYDSYPVLFHQRMCERFPNAPIDLAITAIGGEHSEAGAARFEKDVLSLRPDVVFIDYAINDRGIGPERSRAAWTTMIQACRSARIPVVLLTATPIQNESVTDHEGKLYQQCEQIRDLATEWEIPLVDGYAEFERLVGEGHLVTDFLSHPVHPNRRGHGEVADELLRLFPKDL